MGGTIVGFNSVQQTPKGCTSAVLFAARSRVPKVELSQFRHLPELSPPSRPLLATVLSVSVFLLLPEKGIIKSQRVFDVLLATDRGHYIKYFPYMDSPQSIGE